MSMHNEEDKSDVEKLMYLRQVVKGGTVAQVIEGFLIPENSTQKLLLSSKADTTNQSGL